MSNNNDEYSDGLDPGFFSRMKELRAENERIIKENKAFDEGKGPKPDYLRREPLSEQEMHDKAKDQGKQQAADLQYQKDAGFLDKDGNHPAQNPEKAPPEKQDSKDGDMQKGLERAQNLKDRMARKQADRRDRGRGR